MDGDLWQCFKKNIPEADFQRIETWGIAGGVPDLNYCLDGAEGWIELKGTKGWKVDIRPAQIAWAERRQRAGGRVFLAVRRRVAAGPRREAADDLYLFNGVMIRLVFDHGLPAGHGLAMPDYSHWRGGPQKWDWVEIKKKLVYPLSFSR